MQTLSQAVLFKGKHYLPDGRGGIQDRFGNPIEELPPGFPEHFVIAGRVARRPSLSERLAADKQDGVPSDHVPLSQRLVPEPEIEPSPEQEAALPDSSVVEAGQEPPVGVSETPSVKGEPTAPQRAAARARGKRK
jgi:hypothetical protein